MPERAEIVRRIFRLYCEGMSYGAIADLLNRERIASPRASIGWMVTSIGSILANSAYIGRVRWNRREWRKVPGTNTLRYADEPTRR